MSPPKAPNSSMLLSPFFFLAILTGFLVQFPIFGWAIDERYTDCGNGSCGNMSVSYPLRIAGREEYCGHPSYDVLECQGDELVATIMSRKYQVLDTVLEKQSLTIVRMDLLDSICPQQLGGFVMDYSLFNYTDGDSNATLSYNCSPQPSSDYFNCSTSDGFQANTVAIRSADYGSSYEGSCNSSIVIPVLKSSASDFVSGTINASELLKDGFEIRWTLDMEECRTCTASGGRCGYNTTTETFSCFCPDGAYESKCPGAAPGSDPVYNQAPAPEAPSSMSCPSSNLTRNNLYVFDHDFSDPEVAEPILCYGIDLLLYKPNTN